MDRIDIGLHFAIGLIAAVLLGWVLISMHGEWEALYRACHDAGGNLTTVDHGPGGEIYCELQNGTRIEPSNLTGGA